VIAVRDATPDDVSDLVAAYQWLFDPPGRMPPQWDPARATDILGRVLARPRSTVLVADEGPGQLVGFCSVYLDIESARFGQRAWVEDLAVHPDHRSLGVGKALLDAAKDWAETRGATHLELDSGDDRVAAHRFYNGESPSWQSRSFGWELRH
jgi:GNAT superfamily N-acetyltransferase